MEVLGDKIDTKKEKKFKYIWNVEEREDYDGQETRFKQFGWMEMMDQE